MPIPSLINLPITDTVGSRGFECNRDVSSSGDWYWLSRCPTVARQSRYTGSDEASARGPVCFSFVPFFACAHCLPNPDRSGVSAATLLVLLAGAAGARIVAADLGAAANDLLNGLAVSRAGHAGLLEFPALPALGGFFEVVHRGCNLAWTPAIAVTGLNDRPSCRAGFSVAGRGDSDGGFAASDDLHQVQIADGVFLKALHHVFEHVEGLALIFDQWIFLSVTSEADSLFEVIHIEQVVFPLLVEHAQHNHALVVAHGLGTDQLLLGFVALFQLVENRIAQLLPAQGVGFDAFGKNVYPEASKDRVFKTFDVPIRRMCLYRNVLLEKIAENSSDVILQNEVLLIDAFEQATAEPVHRFPLLVHDVVVFEQVLASFEVLRLDRFLGLLDSPADES